MDMMKHGGVGILEKGNICMKHSDMLQVAIMIAGQWGDLGCLNGFMVSIDLIIDGWEIFLLLFFVQGRR